MGSVRHDSSCKHLCTAAAAYARWDLPDIIRMYTALLQYITTGTWYQGYVLLHNDRKKKNMKRSYICTKYIPSYCDGQPDELQRHHC